MVGKILGFIGGIVVLCGVLAVLAVVFGGSKSATTSVSSGSGTAATGSSTTAKPAAAVGDEVTVGAASWRVTDATLRESFSGNGMSAKPSGQFLIVQTQVTNNGDKAESLVSPKVTDAQGREFETSSDGKVIMANDQNCTLKRINPGTSQTCTFVYDVPVGAKGLRFMAGELGLFGDTVPVTLN